MMIGGSWHAPDLRKWGPPTVAAVVPPPIHQHCRVQAALASGSLAGRMQVRVSELVALTAGHGAAVCPSMLFVGVATNCTSAQSHR
jgi:hypothetical protein